MNTYRKSQIPPHLLEFFEPAEIGLEPTPDEFVAKLVEVFREVRRVLRDDGTLWLNIGDSYTSGGRTHERDPDAKNVAVGTGAKRAALPDGLKPKDLIGIPWMLAFALRADGWYLRQDIIWAKATSGVSREGNGMPESVRDRCAKSHEYLFLLAKSERYYFDCDAIKEPAQNWGTRDRSNMRQGTTDPKLKHGGLSDCSHEMGNRRSVWRVNPSNYQGAHFATFPTALITPCILAGAPAGGIVLDPFFGSGTTGQVAQALGRQFIGIELNEAYKPLQDERLRQPSLLLEAA